MTPRDAFDVRRYDLDDHFGAVEIEATDLPLVRGYTFEDARDKMIADLRTLIALAERLEEPTP